MRDNFVAQTVSLGASMFVGHLAVGFAAKRYEPSVNLARFIASVTALDMPLWPSASSPKWGLGLRNSIPGMFVVEGAMWIAALAI